MAKLYYGSGSCTIAEGNVIAVELRFKGNIKIKDKTSDDFLLMNQGNGIMIFPIKLNTGYLNNLFDYMGEFKIISVIAADINAEKVPTTIHRVMDYTELLAGDTESMTIPTENMNATYVSGIKMNKTTSSSNYLNNLNTKDWDVRLYLKSGLAYTGAFNVSLKDNSATTGTRRNISSEDLYVKIGRKLTHTKNPSLIPPATLKRREMNDMAKLKGRSKLRKLKNKLKRRR